MLASLLCQECAKPASEAIKDAKRAEIAARVAAAQAERQKAESQRAHPNVNMHLARSVRLRHLKPSKKPKSKK